MDKYYLIGDIHGSATPVLNFIERNNLDETDTIILLGDAGLNYYLNKRDRNFKTKLAETGLNYFVIRGNHEERPSNVAKIRPEEWEKQTYLCGKVWVEKEFPTIRYAMDYVSTYTINGYSTLVIPGAYSVDKFYRLQMGYNWFKDEQLTEKEMSKGISLIDKMNWNVDLVLSHTCPICYQPTDLFISCIDQSTVDATMERYLGGIEYRLNYKLWCWGHYHHYRDYPIVDGKHCIMLSAGNEGLELEQAMNDLFGRKL